MGGELLTGLRSEEGDASVDLDWRDEGHIADFQDLYTDSRDREAEDFAQ